MRIMLIGDICGRSGRQVLARRLPGIVLENRVDFVVANAENAAGGIGLTPDIADEILSYGVHVLTSGNHIWKKREIYSYLEEQRLLLRPCNYPPGAPGRGWGIFDLPGRPRVAVINVQGRVFMSPVDCPFRAVEAALSEIGDSARIHIVDIHAEATSEKAAMGWFLDGRVSAVLGTHTHVQTADERILPGGTGYITDVGMTGSLNSVLGMKKDIALRRFLTGLPERFEPARKHPAVMGVVVEVDPQTGRCTEVTRFRVPEELPETPS